MNIVPHITDVQKAFIQDVSPVLKCMPGTIHGLAGMLSVKSSVLRGFLQKKNGIEDDVFLKLVNYANSEYMFNERCDGYTFHSFNLNGSYTLFPSSKKELVDVYDCVTCGGDITTAFEIIEPNDYPFYRYRFILIIRYSQYILLCIHKDNDFLDYVLEKKMLFEIDGIRIAANGVYSSLNEHATTILNEYEQRELLDLKFFSHKSLLFDQISISLPKEDIL